jgi:hypothetical protein
MQGGNASDHFSTIGMIVGLGLFFGCPSGQER